MTPLRRIPVLAAAVLLLSCLHPACALAGGNPSVKLTRGIVNLGSGWLEVPNQVAEKKNSGSRWWITGGLVRGLVVGTGRTFYGIYDILTFPVAPYDVPRMTPDTLIAPKPSPRETGPLPSRDQ